MYSIRRRLNYSIIAIIVTLFMLQWFMVQYAIQHLTEEIVLTRLQHDAESILAEIQFDAESQVALPAGRLAHVYDRPFSGHYYLVHKKDSRLRSRSLWDWDIKTPELPSGQSKVDIAVGPLSQQLMILHNGFTKNNIHLVISVGEDVTDLLEDEKELLVAYASASVAALIGLILFQMIILSRGLAPAATATKQLSAMERGEIKSLDEDVPLEIHPLVVEINRLMKLLTQRIQRSRNALGNLAHAYKTPLSAINQLVSSHSGLDDETKQQLLNQVNLMKRLTDRELKRARLSGDVN
ncbi:MAG: ATP-binding protein, partial [Gammaproteobacteria bacterium]|nr:ATP-binding protein [Gammaproteobacteria bacterium]